MAGRLRGGDAAGAGRGAAAALAVAVGLGAAILVLLGLFGERLICLTGCAPNLVAPALTYLRVRMLAAPAVVITMVAQVRARARVPPAQPWPDRRRHAPARSRPPWGRQAFSNLPFCQLRTSQAVDAPALV